MSASIPAPQSLQDRSCPAPRIAVASRRPRRSRVAERALVTVRPVLERAVAAVPVLAGRVTVICEPGTVARVDEAVVEQVVVHLLHLEAAIPDHRVVWVSAVPAAGGVVLTVEDDAPWVLDDAALRRGRNGSAATLRLARVAHLARTHGGTSWIEPAVDQGLCFVVDLPAARPL